MQRNSISRGELLTSQGSAYLMKPSSHAKIHGRHPRLFYANIYHGHLLVLPCNQVANYAQLRNIMAPFKPFLSPKWRFEWTPELERAFQASKESIIGEIRHGVEIFDPRNEPAYAQIGLVKASGTSCHRNIGRVTRVYLNAVRMVGESRWPDPDS